MSQLLALLVQGLIGSAFDIDNALYMTSVLQTVRPERQRTLIAWGLLVELIARFLLVAFFRTVIGGSQTLFALFGLKVSLDTLALLGAGAFLFVRSGRELLDLVRERDGEDVCSPADDQLFWRVLLEMSLVNLVLSVDTLVALMATVSEFWTLVYIFVFSALLRLLFVQQIAAIVHRVPGVHVVLLSLLVLVGVELFAHGLGLKVPEALFNSAVLAALIGAILYQRRFTKRRNVE
jgi:predicted tellurium resistance membrane protein TerC